VSSKATRNSLVAIAAFACMLPIAAQAAWDTRAPENAFVYRGNPIDPRCMRILTSPKVDAPTQIDLADCTKPGPINLRDREFWVLTKGTPLGTAFDSYEVLARDGARFIISSDTNDDGFLMSSYLTILHKRDKTLVVDEKLMPGKYTCDFLPPTAKVRGRHLTWIESLAPYDLLELGGLTMPKTDLDDKIGCWATREIDYDLDTGRVRTTSAWLDFFQHGAEHGGPIRDMQGSTERFTYQHCFNAYFNGLIAKGDADFDADGIKRFADGFVSTCQVKRP